jgi:phospholipid/cholesterol/gamma-HCH transport system substrate-binding protein
VRGNLQTFLDEFGDALIKHGGAEGFRELYRSSAGAFKYTSQVNEALLGTRPHDLSGLVRDLDSTVRALGQNEAALQQLVTNLRIFTGAFAAESASLERAVANLPGAIDAGRVAFDALNPDIPERPGELAALDNDCCLRAFAREALPGVRSTVPALDAANPFINQLRKLMRPSELRGLVAGLRPTIPDLARLTRQTIPFLRQSRALSSCFNEVIIPWSNDTVDPPPGYPHDPGGRVFEETGYQLVGVGGESRAGDANGQYVRIRGGGGTNFVIIPPAPGRDEAFGLTPFQILGAMPRISDSAKTSFTPGIPCETQQPPDLSAVIGDPPMQTSAPAATLDNQPVVTREALLAIGDLAPALARVDTLRERGVGVRARALERQAYEEYAEIVRRYERGIRSLGGGN